MDTKKLRQKILDLAIHGKLVPQDPNDEPASVLLERIREEKDRLIKEGKIKKSKSTTSSDTSHYENVPFEIPEGWCWCHIDDLCYSIFAGGDKPSTFSATQTSECNIPIYANAIQQEGLYGYTDKAVVKMPAITVSARGTIGFVCVRKTPFVPIVRLITLVPIYCCKIEYIAYALQYFVSPAEGSSIPQLTVPTFRSTLIPIPPLEEQKRIVEQMETIHSIIDSIDENKHDLDSEIKQAKSKILDLAIHGKLVSQEASDEPASELLKRINPKAVASCDNPHYAEPYELPDGWIWCKLMNLCSFLSRGKSPKYSETDTTYPVFAQKCNLKEGGISLEKAQFLEPTTLNRWPDVYHLQTGDVLVNSTGTGTVGRTRLFNESCLGDYPFVVPDSHVSVIRTYDDIVSEYIFALMSSSWIQTYLEDNLAGSTNQKELYIGVLQNVDVPLPPVAEQKRIADKIESLYQQLDNIADHIE